MVGGGPDAGPPDAGPPDAGPPDAGPPDARDLSARDPDAGALGDVLHAHGLRVTPQRRRVLAAVRRLGHATADDVAEHLAAQAGSAPVDTSTVYRSLGVLEDVGLVGRTLLDRRAPSFHPVEHGGHLHLICDRCGAMTETPADAAAVLAVEVLARDGFVVDATHLALRGTCAACRTLEGTP